MKLQDFDFRIWDKTKEEFLKKEPTLIKLDNERVIAGRISRFYANTADITDMLIGNDSDLEIELWTGYFDKNGNKIYENDIIKNES
ncbi:YopX family protein, partial [Campylobacter jejuni]